MEWPAELDATHARHRRGATTVIVRRDWADALPVERMLDGAPRSAWGRPVAHALAGRGAIDVVETARGPIVAKALQRGGVLGALARRTFFDPMRPLREAAVAEALRRRGVDTPPVVAVRIRRAWPGWTLELATARRTDARDLLEVLVARGAGGAHGLARALGRTLRRLHDLGLRHRDLQLKNLLVPDAVLEGDPDVALVVLDLDRCTLGPALRETERARALARLGRWLAKRGRLDAATRWRSRVVVRAYVEAGAGDAAPVATRPHEPQDAGDEPGEPGPDASSRPVDPAGEARAAAVRLWHATRVRLVRDVRWHSRFWGR